jgi:CNT family concentrative nucleoside transporter
MQKTLGTSGAETLSAAANIFVGQTEAPLVIRPYIQSMTVSELNAVMVGGFATMAGGVLAAFVDMGIPPEHLLAASVIAAPAALLVAKIMQPETDRPQTLGSVRIKVEEPACNVVEAIANGATGGLKLALNVGAMLIVFLALIAFLNLLLGLVGTQFGHYFGNWVNRLFASEFRYSEWSLEMILGYLFAPLAWLMGIEWSDCTKGGELLGLKMATNEFVAYGQLRDLMGPTHAEQLQLQANSRLSQLIGAAAIGNPLGAMQFYAIPSMVLEAATSSHVREELATHCRDVISERSQTILTYALCGFANFSSIGIQLGGIGGIAPQRRGDLARLGLRAMLGGTLAAFMTACIAGILL